MRVYLNGPVDEVEGAEAFTEEQAQRIRIHGHEVFVARRVWKGSQGQWVKYRMMVAVLLRCDSVCHLPGYELSWQGREAARIAEHMGVPVWMGSCGAQGAVGRVECKTNAPHEPRRDSGVALDGVVGNSEPGGTPR